MEVNLYVQGELYFNCSSSPLVAQGYHTDRLFLLEQLNTPLIILRFWSKPSQVRHISSVRKRYRSLRMIRDRGLNAAVQQSCSHCLLCQSQWTRRSKSVWEQLCTHSRISLIVGGETIYLQGIVAFWIIIQD